jgi:hypothetical protein
MYRGLGVLLALCLWLLPIAPASASPRLCTAADSGGYGSTANQPRPNGVTVTYLYAKLDGEHWTEPPGVCVAIGFRDSDPFNRYLQVNLWSAPPGFFFDLSTAGIPTGTPIALGLSLPASATPVMAFGQWADGVVGFGPTEVAIQAKTAPWTYVQSAYNSDQTASSGTIDCSQGSTTWSSTFGSFVRLKNLMPDGTEGGAYSSLIGSFFEANSSNMPFPYLSSDGHVLIDVLGCGDKDPKTLEGHFAGFMAPPALAFLGLAGAALDEGSPFMSSLVGVSDAFAGARVDSHIRPAHAKDLAFEPIPGVTFPDQPSGPGPLGLMARADFSYSKHTLDLHVRKANVRLVKNCARRGAKVVRRHGKLRCRARVRPGRAATSRRPTTRRS